MEKKKTKRLQKLLDAQRKIEALAAAESARAAFLHANGSAEHAALLLNASGDGHPKLAGMISGLCSIARLSVRNRELERMASRCADAVLGEKQRTRQLEHLLTARKEEARLDADRRELEERLEESLRGVKRVRHKVDAVG